MINYKVAFSYDGSHYYGSQRQPNFFTVETHLLKLLKPFFKDISSLILSSRTDKGVHANYQVANFHSNISLNIIPIINNINFKSTYIKIISIDIVDKEFHARKSAISREYIYYFTHSSFPVYYNNYVSRINYNVDVQMFNQLLQHIIGIHDFVAFKKTGSINYSTIRTIYSAQISTTELKVLTESNKPIILNKVKIVGNSFLYQMIRNIVGCILHILRSSKLNESDFVQFIRSKKRIFNFEPAPPHGLYLNKITY